MTHMSDTNQDGINASAAQNEGIAERLKGSNYKSIVGELFLCDDFRFRRDHGTPVEGKWDVSNFVLFLRAADDSIFETFGIRDELKSLKSALEGGSDYTLHTVGTP